MREENARVASTELLPAMLQTTSSMTEEIKIMEEIKARNLYEFIDIIKIRTAMYIGNESLSVLSANINGYNWACHLKGIDEKLNPDFSLFHDFVANYYLYSESTAGWTNIILAENYGNETQALKDFYKLFDLFRTTPKITNAKKILYSILDKLISDGHLTNKVISNSENTLTSLKGLANKLEQVKFSFEYDNILEEFEQFAQTDKHFETFLIDLKK